MEPPAPCAPCAPVAPASPVLANVIDTSELLLNVVTLPDTYATVTLKYPVASVRDAIVYNTNSSGLVFVETFT